MQFYTKQHKFYCGIDLHARKMYACILDSKGNVLVHRNIATNREQFLHIIKPYREDIAVAVECIFTWYWIADLCRENEIPFILGHALYMKAIHGGKAKNDKVDSREIVVLLKGGMMPTAYVCDWLRLVVNSAADSFAVSVPLMLFPSVPSVSSLLT